MSEPEYELKEGVYYPLSIVQHYSQPTNGQVTKAVMRYLAENLKNEDLEKIVDKKIGRRVEERIDKLLQSKRFEDSVVQAIAFLVKRDKEEYERSGSYGLAHRLNYLIQEELKRTVLKDFKISIERVTE